MQKKKSYNPQEKKVKISVGASAYFRDVSRALGGQKIMIVQRSLMNFESNLKSTIVDFPINFYKKLRFFSRGM